jgi:hypothetical protein
MLTDTQIYKESGRKEMLPGCSRCNNLSSASDMGTQVTIANGPPETDATKVQTGYHYVSMEEICIIIIYNVLLNLSCKAV